jgi:hypothetical protein
MTIEALAGDIVALLDHLGSAEAICSFQPRRSRRVRQPTNNRPDQAGKRAESAPSADHVARDRSTLLGSAAPCRRDTKVILIWGESLPAP